MPFVPFGEKFPDIAERETRAVTVPNDNLVPRGKYGFVDSYCDEVDCDCRRVFLSVYSSEQKPVAVIAFGWESEKFYADWMGSSDPEIIKDLKGPVLNLVSPQSKFANNWLKFITEVLLKDKQYVERLKKHYQLFRKKIEEEPEPVEKTTRSIVASQKVGRNEPCPCGSGKKYKKCCYVVLH